jgi:hypothetical protein
LSGSSLYARGAWHAIDTANGGGGVGGSRGRTATGVGEVAQKGCLGLDCMWRRGMPAGVPIVTVRVTGFVHVHAVQSRVDVGWGRRP